MDTIPVNNVSLTFSVETFTCIYGPPGRGKSTLLRLIAGLEWPDGGRILIGSKDVTPHPPMVREVSYHVAQGLTLYPNMNVYRNIAYPLKNNEIKGKKRLTEG